ncbi:MAG: aminoacyl-tRNA deacylase [Chloroflexi bacterium]|nr:aminoacyl-tRNA deacylase [Chloroflexota bacterium]
MPDAPEKTNAMRLLEAKRIPYRAHYFSPEIHSATEVADAVGLPAGQVFKTLVVLPQSAKARPLLAIVPSDRELDLKQLAAAAGEKRVAMAAHKEAESLTGLLVGGISALALLQKGWRVFLDASAEDYTEILVSAGQRGINVQLAVRDLVALTKARVATISRPPATPP